MTVFCLERTTPDRVAEFMAMGASRVVLRPPVDTVARFEGFLDKYASLLAVPA